MKIRYRELKSYKYQLWETYSLKTSIRPDGELPVRTYYIDLEMDGTLHIRAGYAWDGPSGPTIDTPNFMRGSLVHDAFFQLFRMGLLSKAKREAADRLLWAILLEDGMSVIRAALVYRGVRAAGWAYCAPRKDDIPQVLEAP